VILRSVLFAPANHARHAEKALTGPNDGVILDLEDAVSVGQKPRARMAARDLVQNRIEGGPVVFVRINALNTPFAYDDLREVVVLGLDGIVLPKVESASQVQTVDWMLQQMERERDMRPGSISIVPIVETALGLSRIEEIAAAPRVRRVSFGAGDFTLDTAMRWSPGNEGVLWGRIRVVIASRAAGLDAPLDTVFPDLADREGFTRDAEMGKKLGFQGKSCIHPSQVEMANRIFSPSAEEVEEARCLVEAFEHALAEGSASIQVAGQFVDYPVAERARRIVDLAERVKVREAVA